mmetsp:Transcript_35923/g.32313  ORF Transcript_35923/g.32313 Transcript_35923/m.32313 type:complete len:212 (+) Transcript_35923:714-1349(+)
MNINSMFASDAEVNFYMECMVGSLAIEGVAALLLLHLANRNLNKAKRISQGTIWMFIVFSINLSLLNFSYSMNFSGYITLLAVLYFLVGFLLGVKLVAKIIDAIRESGLERPNESASKMHCWVILMCICTIITLYDDNLNPLSYFMVLYPLPQIIDNYTLNKKYKFNPLVHIFMGLPKFAYLSYTSLDPDNMFRLTPNRLVVIISLSIVLF